MFPLPPPAPTPTLESQQSSAACPAVSQEPYPGYTWEKKILDRLGDDHTWGPATLEALARLHGGQADHISEVGQVSQAGQVSEVNQVNQVSQAGQIYNPSIGSSRSTMEAKAHTPIWMGVDHQSRSLSNTAAAHRLASEQSRSATSSEKSRIGTPMNSSLQLARVNEEECDASVHARHNPLSGVSPAPHTLDLATEEARLNRLLEVTNIAVPVYDVELPPVNEAQRPPQVQEAQRSSFDPTADEFRLNRVLQLANIVSPEDGSRSTFNVQPPPRHSLNPQKRFKKAEAIQMELHRRGFTVDHPSSKLRRALRREAIFGKPNRY